VKDSKDGQSNLSSKSNKGKEKQVERHLRHTDDDGDAEMDPDAQNRHDKGAYREQDDESSESEVEEGEFSGDDEP
jgi:hypothetical protein